MKQTAVEWLGLYIKGITTLNCEDIIEKALEMEKEQIKKAFEEGMFHHTNGLCPNEYYNETFKSE